MNLYDRIWQAHQSVNGVKVRVSDLHTRILSQLHIWRQHGGRKTSNWGPGLIIYNTTNKKTHICAAIAWGCRRLNAIQMQIEFREEADVIVSIYTFHAVKMWTWKPRYIKTLFLRQPWSHSLFLPTWSEGWGHSRRHPPPPPLPASVDTHLPLTFLNCPFQTGTC